MKLLRIAQPEQRSIMNGLALGYLLSALCVILPFIFMLATTTTFTLYISDCVDAMICSAHVHCDEAACNNVTVCDYLDNISVPSVSPSSPSDGSGPVTINSKSAASVSVLIGSNCHHYHMLPVIDHV